MHTFPKRVQAIIDGFDALPGVGPKHATRLALYLLDHKDLAKQFADDVSAALATVAFCKQCQTVAETELCDICSDTRRDRSTICVVAHVQDIEPIERTDKFNGVFHVLHGVVNPVEGVTPDDIRAKELIARVKKNGMTEIIFALDATAEGEATVMYLTKVLKNMNLTLSKLARGIPFGSNIEYTDEVTLSSALDHREKL